MGKLDFCPYDGKKIDKDNLAYEIIPACGWEWEAIKSQTIIGNSIKPYIDEHDQKRVRFYGDPSMKVPVMILANKEKSGKSGLTLLRNYVDQDGKNHENSRRNSYGDAMRQMYSIKISLPGYMGISNTTDDMEGFRSNGPKKIHYRSVHGYDEFLDDNEDLVFSAMPCCPFCHNRLPMGWEEADDFMAISLFPSSLNSYMNSVTSLLDRLWSEEGRIFQRRILHRGRKLTLVPSCFGKDVLFLSAQLANGRNLMVAIYNHTESKTWMNHPLLLKQTYADLFFLGSKLKKRDAGIELRISNTRFQHCRMLSMEEQARYQKQNAGSKVMAEELLRDMKIEQIPVEYMQEKTNCYADRQCLLQEIYRKYPKHKMKFIGILMDQDPKIAHVSGDFSKERLEEYDLLGKQDPKEFKEDYEAGVFWYDKKELQQGIEPIIACILDKLDEIGW